jgi:hypothetical protein
MKPKWIITWNIGYGECASIVEADDEEQAGKQAYEAAREDFENSADYGAEPYSKERAEELEIE